MYAVPLWLYMHNLLNFLKTVFTVMCVCACVCACACACACVCGSVCVGGEGGWVHCWLSGIHSELPIERLGVQGQSMVIWCSVLL